jgi:hypothetical protein
VERAFEQYVEQWRASQLARFPDGP